jgi:endonuclease YncB( thermonuclease family)
LKALSFLVLVAAALLALVFENAGLLATMNRPEGPQLVGVPVVSDGDSLRLDGRRIRLVHIDACEIGQPATRDGRPFDCGAWARTAVRRLIGDGPVRCEAEGIDQYDRVLAECFTGDGASINLAAMREGIAFVYDRRRAPRRFLEAEEAAKADRLGVWAAVVDHPREHRRGAG